MLSRFIIGCLILVRATSSVACRHAWFPTEEELGDAKAHGVMMLQVQHVMSTAANTTSRSKLMHLQPNASSKAQPLPEVEDPWRLRMPNWKILVRELFMIPILFWVAWRSPGYIFFGVVCIQLAVHALILTTSFRCNPLSWCNLPALGFGIIYISLGSYSLLQLVQNESDEKRPDPFFQTSIEAVIVVLIGGYIMISHTIAIITGGELNPISFLELDI
mmetsp:Transcript_97424/g.172544  ORF Transcript_97424/g.172544 Transcript_97424/m.172544 type:complete len:218 (+) Transcript_97424:70-723(+)